jgi:hypothetical protein
MKKIFLINFALMEKIADKKNGITTEDATAFIIGIEMFFVCLIVEFSIMRILPFRISNAIMFGTMAVIWYYTHYILRKSLKKTITDAGTKREYKELDRLKQRRFLTLSIVIFFLVFVIFFAASVWAIGGYDKRWN